VTNANRHPCFDATAAKTFGRVHLPVAPSCNIQCGYCDRRYDCANENRPGVTSAVLSPGQALWYLREVLRLDPSISVAGVAGPGDPFAEPEKTLETLSLVHGEFPKLLLCTSSNGLNLAPYAGRLSELGLTHVTVTVNAVDPAIGGKIYAWVRDGVHVLRREEAAACLIRNQLTAIAACAAAGITVKVNTVVVPGVNDEHVEAIACAAAGAGARLMNCMPLMPVAGTPLAGFGKPGHELMQKARWRASQHVDIVHHCRGCRSDAAGKIGSANDSSIQDLLLHARSMPLKPAEDRPNVAVATREGLLISGHLGGAESFTVFGRDGAGFREITVRKAPPPGGGAERWAELSRVLSDCRAVLVERAGETPVRALEAEGIRVVITEGLIADALESVYSGAVPAAAMPPSKCGGCGGGGGCG
jgi:nitrogen fixation protein NifB